MLRTLALLALVTLALLAVGPVQAGSSAGYGALSDRDVRLAPASATIDSLPPLKAVLVVGPLDGDNGPQTTQLKQNMDLAADVLIANGVTVHRFYAPQNDWNQIVAAAQGAHFFYYSGHGVYWGDPALPDMVGGMALSSMIVIPDEIRARLRPANNAVVMVYGCYAAGSSGFDGGAITSAEARRRVAQYSAPFFDVGAGGYFSNWHADAFQMFTRYLFEGHTLGSAYESYWDFGAATVERYMHPQHTDMVLWLDKDFIAGANRYNNAFSGRSARTLRGLFVPISTNLPYKTYLPLVRR
jgi:hypothetical protein